MKTDFKYELTIGMIVKNDAKRLRTCLETLKPLREAISCQLIITDTGSTDGSREVAEEHADILLDFEWCDDFSAARNTGVELAEGRWFAYFDSDHEFDESILELAKFLKSKESHTEDNASVHIRNYKKSEDRAGYYDTYGSLLFNFKDGKRYFVNRVHEGIYRSRESYPTDVLLHHWGYCDDLYQIKADRNDPLLLKSIEENPEDLHQQIQLLTSTEDAMVRYRRALEAVEIAERVQGNAKDKTGSYYCIHAICGSSASKVMDWDTTEKMIAKIKGHAPDSLLELEAKGLCIELFFQRNEYDAVIEEFAQFKPLYEKLQKEPDRVFGGIYPYRFFVVKNFYQTEFLAILSGVKSNNFSKAKELLKDTEAYTFQESAKNHFYLKRYLQTALHINEYSCLGKVYQCIFEHDSPEELQLVQEVLEGCLNKISPEERADLFAELTKNIVDSYTALLYVEEQNFQKEAFTEDIAKLIMEEDGFHLNPNNAKLLYAYVLTGEDPTGFVGKNDVSTLAIFLPNLFKQYKNLSNLIEDTYNNPNFTIDNIKEEKLWAYLGMRTVLHLSEAKDPNIQRINKLFTPSLHLMVGYANKAYNPYLLSDEGRGVIHSEELFCCLGSEALAEENPLDFIKGLKKALEVCPSYAPIIEVFTKEMKKAEEKKQEFSSLGGQIKTTIQSLLAAGSKPQAKMFLEKYKAINPNDPDIETLAAQCE